MTSFRWRRLGVVVACLAMEGGLLAIGGVEHFPNPVALAMAPFIGTALLIAMSELLTGVGPTDPGNHGP